MQDKKVISKEELFQMQAMNFNFEKNADQLVEIALDRGYVSKIGDNEYLINDSYGE